MIICFVFFQTMNRDLKIKKIQSMSNNDRSFLSSVAGANTTRLSEFKQVGSRYGKRVPRALNHLADISIEFNPQAETPFFWDVHFAGESIAESVFSKCHFLIQACEHGLKQPDYNDETLQVFEILSGELYVNVDTTTKHGIQRAKKLQLAEKGIADIMISPQLHSFSSSIFSSFHKGRLFALFRHPIDRSVSMFYYLSGASWDPMYNPELKMMSIVEYAKSSSVENNWMTRFLINKQRGKLKKEDMLVAKEILRTKCLVGLYEDIQNSLKRFHEYFGWSQTASKEHISQCRSAVVEAGDERLITPKLELNSKEYNSLVQINLYDLELYEYVKRLYKIQGEQIFGLS